MKTLQTQPLVDEEQPAPAAELEVPVTRLLDSAAPVTRVLETTLLEPDAWPLLALQRAPAVMPYAPDVAPPDAVSADTALPDTASSKETGMPAAAPASGDAPATGARRMPTAGDLLRGRYRIRRLLGQGGTGMVFEAFDAWRLQPPEGDPRVALKLLRAEVARNGPRFTAFQREFQHLQLLSHPNIVRVHDFDRDGELAFFTMEYLSGAQLGEVLTQRRGHELPQDYALAILRDVGAAVAHAHSRGIVHGDLNPANTFVTATGQIRVLDFGASNQQQVEPWISAPDDPPRVATRPWASCEVLERGVPMPADDVYSLACLAYLLLAGRHPFGERSALQARNARLRPRRPPGLSARTWWALRAGLRFERERRPRDAAEWLGLLDFAAAVPRLPSLSELIERHHRPPQRWWRWVAGAAAAVVVLAFSWWAGVHTDLPGAARMVVMAPAAPHKP